MYVDNTTAATPAAEVKLDRLAIYQDEIEEGTEVEMELGSSGSSRYVRSKMLPALYIHAGD